MPDVRRQRRGALERSARTRTGVVLRIMFLGLLVATAAAAETATHAAGTGVPPIQFIDLLFVFMLATFIGLGVITRVSRLLHTPLMSLTNAISAIAVVGAILVAGGGYDSKITWLGAIALFASVTNIVSGFLITDRMLKMFRKREGAEK